MHYDHAILSPHPSPPQFPHSPPDSTPPSHVHLQKKENRILTWIKWNQIFIFWPAETQLQMDQGPQQSPERARWKRRAWRALAGTGRDFQDCTLAVAQGTRPAFDKLYLVKLKNFCTERKPSNWWRNKKLESESENLCQLPIWWDSHLEHLTPPPCPCSTPRKQTNLRMHWAKIFFLYLFILYLFMYFSILQVFWVYSK